MSDIIGTETYAALGSLPKSHRDFYLARQDTRLDRRLPRTTGISSDRLTHFALGWSTEPKEGSWDYPADRSDLMACLRTYTMAPEDLQAKMLPLLKKYQAHIEQRGNP